MTNKQLLKKVYKLYQEIDELVNKESYKSKFCNTEVDDRLLDGKWELEMAYNALYNLVHSEEDN